MAKIKNASEVLDQILDAGKAFVDILDHADKVGKMLELDNDESEESEKDEDEDEDESE